MKRLLMTVGLPRSGKSTWARQQGHPIVNPDSIRLALTGQWFFRPAEPMVWATAKLMVRSLFAAGHSTVILDATNINKVSRSEWKSSEWERTYCIFNTPSAVCRERATADNRPDLLEVIRRMEAKQEPVDQDECDLYSFSQANTLIWKKVVL